MNYHGPRRLLGCLLLILGCAGLAAPAAGESPEPTSEESARLESLCYQQTRERHFTEALATARNLVEVRQRRFGNDHWLTVDAHLNVALVERLSQLADDPWKQFIQADQLQTAAAQLQRSGKQAAAVEKAKDALPVYVKLLGEDCTVTLSCRANIVICLLELGRYFEAKPHLCELIEHQPRLKGTQHPDTILALKLLGRFNEAIGDLTDAEDAFRKVLEIEMATAGAQHPETLTAAVDLGKVCSDQRKFAEAEPLLRTVWQRQRALWGDDRTETALTKKVLGTMYCDQGKYAEAEPLLEQSVATLRITAGEKSLATAGAQNALGKFYLRTGRFEKANDNLIDSMAVCLDVLGPKHPLSAKVMSNIADLYETGANPGMARQVRLQCLKICEESFGEINLLTAEALENLARTYIVLSDFALAEPYLLRARMIRGKLLGDDHPQTAAIAAQLAYVYLGSDDAARSEPLFLQALAVLDKSPRPDATEAPRIRGRLALLYQSQGKFNQAESNYRQAKKGLELIAGPDALAVAEIKVGLAQTVLSLGRCREACQLMDEALPIYERYLHRNSPHWLDALGIAATARMAADDTAAAEPLLARALAISQMSMQTAGVYQSARQRMAQMMVMRDLLDLYLSLPITPRTQGSNLYADVLAWKGAIAARQWRDRQYTSADTEPLDAELAQIERRLATLTLRVPEPAVRRQWMGEIYKLTMRKEALAQQRAVYSSKLQTGDREVRPEDVEKVLPPGAALIDLLQYTHTSFKNVDGAAQMQKRQRYLAFVVRRDRPVQRIDIGDVEPIADAVARWRKTRGFRPDQGKTDWAATVGQLVWPRLTSSVGDCSTLLISPDGVLAQLAWNALPGARAGSYLIEDYAIAMVPVPQLLPAMLAPGRLRMRDTVATPPSLLLVGDIDYEASLATTVTPVSATSQPAASFALLKGTAAEVAAIGEQFQHQFPAGRETLLTKQAATEEALWREAGRHQWLHIATHGFYAPPHIKAALAAQNQMNPAAKQRDGVSLFHVDYLNGLALAGANVGAVGEGDDGILTAAELAAMDLRLVDTVVLSGCETGLGELSSGEGAFGMQRALQIAGVRTTVGSLWTVSDDKTNLLMQRFYSNLWERNLPRLQALREAQLWLLRGGGQPAATSAQPQRLSPHYWGAFTLSGDWR